MIVCSALKDNKREKVFCGVRHPYIYELLCSIHYCFDPKDIIEGFVNEKNEFLDRYEAYEEAVRYCQISSSLKEIKANERESMLFSEDLY